MKAKVVKAWIASDREDLGAWPFRAGDHATESEQGFIVRCPHNWTITAHPPRPKASKKKGAKR